jgi:hypothetical protein
MGDDFDFEAKIASGVAVAMIAISWAALIVPLAR